MAELIPGKTRILLLLDSFPLLSRLSLAMSQKLLIIHFNQQLLEEDGLSEMGSNMLINAESSNQIQERTAL